MKTLSFSAERSLRKPELLASYPRRTVPLIDDHGFVLAESAAIVEYLEERSSTGQPLFPGDLRSRATIRRLIREIDAYVAPAYEYLVGELLFRGQNEWDAAQIERGTSGLSSEIAYSEQVLTGDWLFGNNMTAADHALFPFFASIVCFERRKPDLGLSARLGPRVAAWIKRIEALPLHAKTYPPHWRAGR